MTAAPDSRQRPVRVVALGGGTGLSTLLRALKTHLTRNKTKRMRQPMADLAAIVTVTDDGGSSGRLRREYSILPPGDIRNCLVALSRDETLLSRLFQYRFPRGRGLRGHSFGNLFLAALTNVTGDFPEAVRLSGQVLAIAGRIFPSTAQNVTLEAELEDGRVVAGETKISQSSCRIRRVRLVPRRVRPLPEILDSLRKADLILVGPGSLYTSLIPNLLVEGVTDVLSESRGEKVYVANLMTQPGETQGYSAADHVRAIYEHTRPGLFDCVVVNRMAVSPRVLRRYRAQGAEPVQPSVGDLQQLRVSHIAADLLQEQNGIVRHDEKRLAELLVNRFIDRAAE